MINDVEQELRRQLCASCAEKLRLLEEQKRGERLSEKVVRAAAALRSAGFSLRWMSTLLSAAYSTLRDRLKALPPVATLSPQPTLSAPSAPSESADDSDNLDDDDGAEFDWEPEPEPEIEQEQPPQQPQQQQQHQEQEPQLNVRLPSISYDYCRDVIFFPSAWPRTHLEMDGMEVANARFLRKLEVATVRIRLVMYSLSPWVSCSIRMFCRNVLCLTYVLVVQFAGLLVARVVVIPTLCIDIVADRRQMRARVRAILESMPTRIFLHFPPSTLPTKVRLTATYCMLRRFCKT